MTELFQFSAERRESERNGKTIAGDFPSESAIASEEADHTLGGRKKARDQ